MKHIVTIISLFLTSCATILAPSSYKVEVTGEKDVIAVYNGTEYYLPATINAKPQHTKIGFKKECYSSASVDLERSVRVGPLIGNVVFFFIGIPVDFITEEAYKIENTIVVSPELKKLKNC